MHRQRGHVAATAMTTLAIALTLAAAPVLAADQAVTIQGFAFSPSTVTVNVGDSVTWTNNDGATHTATGTGFDTGNIASGASDAVTFANAGSFDYACSIHPQMTGTVVVQAAGGGGGTGATTPPTDTATAVGDTDSGWQTATLAILGLIMIAGTIVTNLLLRHRSEG